MRFGNRPPVSPRVTQDAVLGALVLVFGLVVALVWAPLDSETGIAEKVRGRWTIGDALAPTVAGAVLILSGAGILAGAWLRPVPPAMRLSNLGFLASFIACTGIALAVMRFAGPMAAELTVGDYRPLRDEAPWKYVGFVSGGGLLIFTLVALVERRLGLGRLVLAVAVALALALLYDLPFEDLLLPPNGDV